MLKSFYILNPAIYRQGIRILVLESLYRLLLNRKYCRVLKGTLIGMEFST